MKLTKNVNYLNAGTVEFLVKDDEFYFIEVNPRVQVEHTITEMITGVDIVQSQILIADGHSLHSKMVGVPKQEEVVVHGFAIQSRVTTEDPLNNFMRIQEKLWRIDQAVVLVYVLIQEIASKVQLLHRTTILYL